MYASKLICAAVLFAAAFQNMACAQLNVLQ